MLINVTFERRGKNGKRILLLLIFLSISWLFSYLGLATASIDGKEHLERQYNTFANKYHTAWSIAEESVSADNDPISILSSIFENAEATMEYASTKLMSIQNELGELATDRIWTQTNNPDGSKTFAQVSNPANEIQVQSLLDSRAQIEPALTMFTYNNGEYELSIDKNVVLTAMRGQLSNAEITNDFIDISQQFDTWLTNYNHAAVAIYPQYSPFQISMTTLWKEYITTQKLNKSLTLPDYVVQQRLLDPNGTLSDSELQIELKKVVDQYYQEFIDTFAGTSDYKLKQAMNDLTLLYSDMEWKDFFVIALEYLYVPEYKQISKARMCLAWL